MRTASVTPTPAPPARPALGLLDLPGLGRFLRWRHARAALQLPLVLIAVLMIWDGLTGPQLAPKNLATVLTWVHYRGLIVFVLLAAGNLFCLACPFMLPRNLARRLARPARLWPKRLRNKWAATAILALFLFAYERFDLWSTPWLTAWVISGYFAGALLVDSLFRGAAFCKYVCPIGQFNFVSSLISPLEVKVGDLQTCATCRTKDCIKGRADLPGCELWLFQPRKVGNMDCTFCLDCVHACPHDNIGLMPRLPGGELLSGAVRSGIGRFSSRPDLAAMAVIFTFGALINAFGMVSPVYMLEAWLANLLGTRSETLVLGLIFTGGLLIEPLALLYLAAWLTRRAAGLHESLLAIITRYVYALIPLGFGIWLAHYAFHFLSGFWTFVPVLQSILADLGWPLAGAPRWGLGPLAPLAWLTPLEMGAIGLGWLGSALIAYEIARQSAPRRTWQACLPWAGLALLLALAGLWLMGQPMEMRGTFL